MPDIALVISAFKSFEELGLVAYTIVFTSLHRKKSNRVKSGEGGRQ